jgi:hypothetical protein
MEADLLTGRRFMLKFHEGGKILIIRTPTHRDTFLLREAKIVARLLMHLC